MNEIKVLGFSGKKQSGKNTGANFVLGIWMRALSIIEDFKITKKGELWVSDIFGNDEYKGIFDINRNTDAMQDFASEHIYPFVKLYSFADLLKKHVCIDILGLTYEQCYGTDDEKNLKTHLRWEDMPGVITECTPDFSDDEEFEKFGGRLGPYYKILRDGTIYHRPGFMTAREVMQFVGTGIIRKMYKNVWVDATMRKIQKDAPTMAIITDVRFQNEVEGIISATEPMNGKVIRLTRDIYKGQDTHPSEVDLDNYNKFSATIDNDNMTITEQNEKLYELLCDIEWIPHSVPKELLERLPPE